MKCSQLVRSSNPDSYTYVENGSKNNTGANPSEANKVVPVYADTQSRPRCLIYLPDLYLSKLPPMAREKDILYLRPKKRAPAGERLENGSKNNTGANPSEANKVVPVYADTQSRPRCLIYLPDLYLSKLPPMAREKDILYLRPKKRAPAGERLENGSKNNTGANPSEANKVVPVYADTQSRPRCLIYLPDLYLSKLPPMAREKDILYLRPKKRAPAGDLPWYDAMAVGKEKLRTFIQDMCSDAGIKEKRQIIV